MSAVGFIGVVFMTVGTILQEFAMYRKSIISRKKNCNDSKATLLLIYSTGASCEIISIFIMPLIKYLALGEKYIACFHLLILIFLRYRSSTSYIYKVSCIFIFLSCVYCLYRFLIAFPYEETTEKTISFIWLIFISVATFFIFLISKNFKSRRLKIVACSGFGTVVVCCLKNIGIIIYNSLDRVNIDFVEIFIIIVVLTVCSLFQGSFYNKIIEKIPVEKVYALHYIVNLLLGLTVSKFLFDETFGIVFYVSLPFVISSTILIIVSDNQEYERFEE